MMGSDELYRIKVEMGYVVFGQRILYAWRK
jgi:hypothetical protein